MTNALRVLRRTTLLSLGVAVVCAGPATAATPLQIGQISPADPEGCGVGNLPQLATDAAPSYVVPSDGVITEWSHRGHIGSPGSGGVQIWRSAGASDYTLIAKSEIKSFSEGPNSYPTNLAVKAGDLLGLRSASSGTGCYFAAGPGDVAGDGPTNDPAPGETQTLYAVYGVRANVSATIEEQTPPPADTDLEANLKAKKKQTQKGKKACVEVKVKTKEDVTVELSNPRLRSKNRPWGASNQLRRRNNQLWGDWFYVDTCNAFAQGETLVHIEAQDDFRASDAANESATTAVLKLRPKKKAERKIVKALKRGRTVKDKVKLKLTDDAGNSRTEKFNFKLKRKRKG